MSLLKITFIVFLLISIKSIGQNNPLNYEEIKIELLRDKRILQYADSINKSGQAGTLNSDVFKIIETLDKQHPAGFFQMAGNYLNALQLNEASFLYYTGYFRYKYYNAANPKYDVGNDGALLTSFMYVLGEPLGRYLRTNVDNYIEILKKSRDWHLNNDYAFYSRNLNPEKYLEQDNNIKKLIADLETNKLSRQAEWQIEQAKYLHDLDSFLIQIDKNIPIDTKGSTVQDNNIGEQGVTFASLDSMIFCGHKIKAPKDCESVMQGRVLCSTYAVVWNYEPIEDIERHRKEAVAQMNKPKKFDCYILGTKVTAYQEKFESGTQVQVYGAVNGQGLLLSMYLLRDKISTDKDIPDFISQFFTLKKIDNYK